MALEHALLIALREQPASGLELARRFERSIGFFWSATHQQIYRVLGRMSSDGWVEATEVAQVGRPRKLVYAVTPLGEESLAAWLGRPTETDGLRSELALKMRGAGFGDRGAVLDVVGHHLGEHRLRLEHYRGLMARDYPDPASLAGLALDHYLVLRGGILTEETWVAWLSEYLAAHTTPAPTPTPSSTSTSAPPSVPPSMEAT